MGTCYVCRARTYGSGGGTGKHVGRFHAWDTVGTPPCRQWVCTPWGCIPLHQIPVDSSVLEMPEIREPGNHHAWGRMVMVSRADGLKLWALVDHDRRSYSNGKCRELKWEEFILPLLEYLDAAVSTIAVARCR